MTSETRDLSNESGQPIALFKFTRGVVKWFYAGADRQQTLLGDDYAPAAISRGAIQQGAERRKLSLTITLPSNLAVAGNWRPYPPNEAIGITVYTQHYGETDALVDWIGRVVNAKFDGAKLTLTCEPSVASARRVGLSRCWQIGCPKVLYSTGINGCGVDKTAHDVSVTLSAVSGLSLTGTGFGTLPDNRFAGGYIEWTRGDGLVERRSINSHVGTTVVIDYGADDLAAALVVTAYPGCAHDWDDCSSYFSNGDNYGGDLWMPKKNPYDGDPIW